MYAILLQQFILSVECAEEFLNEKLFKLLALACHYDAFSLFAAIYVGIYIYIYAVYMVVRGGVAAFRRYIRIYVVHSQTYSYKRTHSTHSASQAKHNSAKRMNAKEICFARYTTLRELLSRVKRKIQQNFSK